MTGRRNRFNREENLSLADDEQVNVFASSSFNSQTVSSATRQAMTGSPRTAREYVIFGMLRRITKPKQTEFNP